MRGFYGIGLYQPKHEVNIGTTFRSAYILGANYIFTVGRKYRIQSSDTCQSTNHIPYYFYESFQNLLDNRPRHTKIIGVELTNNSRVLSNFCHPLQAIYILGNESYGLHESVISKCDFIVQVPSIKEISLNVATVASIIMYDRLAKLGKNH